MALFFVCVPSFGANINDEGIALAKVRLDKAIANPNLQKYQKIKSDLVWLRRAFNNPFDIDSIRCSGNRQGGALFKDIYDIQKLESKPNKIRVCENFNVSAEELSQFFIHEVSHLALSTTESAATQLEILATFYANATPTLNGYTFYDDRWEFGRMAEWFSNFSKSEWSSLYREWIPIIGFNNKLFWEYAHLNSYTVSDSLAGVQKILHAYKGKELTLLNFQDQFGTTPIMIAAREDRCEVMEEFLKYGGVNLNLRNSAGQRAYDVHLKKNGSHSCRNLLLGYKN